MPGSGPNIPEAQRGTERVCLRLRPEVAARLRGLALAWQLGLAETVEELLERTTREKEE